MKLVAFSLSGSTARKDRLGFVDNDHIIDPLEALGATRRNARFFTICHRSSDRVKRGSGSPAPGLVAATRYCLPGDVIKPEIEKIGVLRNPVMAADAA